MTQPHFKYAQLKDSRSIRLVHLEPANNLGEAISVKFKHARLAISKRQTSNKPQYEALSYTWGEPSNRQIIRCGKESLFVTLNLFQALRQLRYPDKERVLWIDAICINQEDNTEKELQVRLMGEIYSAANRVVVWLGPAVKDTEKVLDLVESLGSLWDDRDSDDQSVITSEELRKHSIPSQDDTLWDSFFEMLCRPWTTRVWVIQEVALSKTTSVLCGDTWFEWEKLAISATIISTYRIFNPTQLEGMDGIPVIDNLRVQVRDYERLSLDNVLAITREYQSSDHRDKIYGLLGVVDDEDRDAILPDYNITTESLYLKIAWHFITERGTLDVLMQAKVGKSGLDLPSWVPDWSSLVSSKYMTLDNVSHGAYWADVSKYEIEISGTKSGKVLELAGKCIDSVEMVSDILSEDSSPVTVREAQSDHVFRKWEAMAMQLNNYSDEYEDTPTNAYWKTLIAGATSENEEVDDEYGRYFADWYSKYRKREACVSVSQVNTKDSELSVEDGITVFSDCVFEACFRRRFGISKAESMCLFPADTKAGDLIVVLLGARFPCILRRNKDGCEFIGMCYVHGIHLDGLLEADSCKKETFCLK